MEETVERVEPEAAEDLAGDESDEDNESKSTESSIGGRIDRFGFIISEDGSSSSLACPEELLHARKIKEGERSIKWARMIKKNWSYLRRWRASKLKRRVRKGIPDSARAFAWYRLSNGEACKDELNVSYYEISIDSVSALTLDEIERDIDRTYPRHFQFRTKEGFGQQSLRRVLQRYASYDPEVGYCQGMGFIAGLLLSYMVEEEAFYTFYSVLMKPRYNLRVMFLSNLIGSQRALHVFGELGRLHLPALWAHFIEHNIHQSMFATEWLMTMFCRGFSFDLAARVFEIFLSEDYKIVYRVALAILKNLEEDFLATDFEGIMTILRTVASTVDAISIIQIAWTIPVRREEIRIFEAEFNQEQESKKNK